MIRIARRAIDQSLSRSSRRGCWAIPNFENPPARLPPSWCGRLRSFSGSRMAVMLAQRDSVCCQSCKTVAEQATAPSIEKIALSYAKAHPGRRFAGRMRRCHNTSAFTDRGAVGRVGENDGQSDIVLNGRPNKCVATREHFRTCETAVAVIRRSVGVAAIAVAGYWFVFVIPMNWKNILSSIGRKATRDHSVVVGSFGGHSHNGRPVAVGSSFAIGDGFDLRWHQGANWLISEVACAIPFDLEPCCGCGTVTFDSSLGVDESAAGSTVLEVCGRWGASDNKIPGFAVVVARER